MNKILICAISAIASICASDLPSDWSPSPLQHPSVLFLPVDRPLGSNTPSECENRSEMQFMTAYCVASSAASSSRQAHGLLRSMLHLVRQAEHRGRQLFFDKVGATVIDKMRAFAIHPTDLQRLHNLVQRIEMSPIWEQYLEIPRPSNSSGLLNFVRRRDDAPIAHAFERLSKVCWTTDCVPPIMTDDELQQIVGAQQLLIMLHDFMVARFPKDTEGQKLLAILSHLAPKFAVHGQSVQRVPHSELSSDKDTAVFMPKSIAWSVQQGRSGQDTVAVAFTDGGSTVSSFAPELMHDTTGHYAGKCGQLCATVFDGFNLPQKSPYSGGRHYYNRTVDAARIRLLELLRQRLGTAISLEDTILDVLNHVTYNYDVEWYDGTALAAVLARSGHLELAWSGVVQILLCTDNGYVLNNMSHAETPARLMSPYSPAQLAIALPSNRDISSPGKTSAQRHTIYCLGKPRSTENISYNDQVCIQYPQVPGIRAVLICSDGLFNEIKPSILYRVIMEQHQQGATAAQINTRIKELFDDTVRTLSQDDRAKVDDAAWVVVV